MEALLASLPIALALLVCPLLMFFMMRGGHQHGDAHTHGDAHDHGGATPQPGANVGTPRDRVP